MRIDAMFTGSRVYGKPKKSSDIDMVILVTPEVMKTLARLADTSTEDGTEREIVEDYGSHKTPISKSLRFGRLNLIVTTSPVFYATWIKGTGRLTKRKPVDREQAVKTFKRLWNMHNVDER